MYVCMIIWCVMMCGMVRGDTQRYHLHIKPSVELGINSVQESQLIHSNNDISLTSHKESWHVLLYHLVSIPSDVHIVKATLSTRILHVPHPSSVKLVSPHEKVSSLMTWQDRDIHPIHIATSSVHTKEVVTCGEDMSTSPLLSFDVTDHIRHIYERGDDSVSFYETPLEEGDYVQIYTHLFDDKLSLLTIVYERT
eukprot:TRINITY_DN13347_c0_g1_i1.p2 TRINITY_DN13347_c0_g1~~TRINITY_DN13347_c0_g1_i1.p2  ORF type:complete len:195 (-),score=25.21 TRINITY_DN13347_c0_g1_i1:16-600(-)